MRVFNTISDAITYARQVLNASQKDAQNIRTQLEAKGLVKFNGLVLLYDELHLLD